MERFPATLPLTLLWLAVKCKLSSCLKNSVHTARTPPRALRGRPGHTTHPRWPGLALGAWAQLLTNERLWGQRQLELLVQGPVVETKAGIDVFSVLLY